MLDLNLFTAWALSSYYRVRGRDAEQGDVPGWVMITVMTAGLVVIIFTAFKTKITSAIDDAINTVTNGTK